MTMETLKIVMSALEGTFGKAIAYTVALFAALVALWALTRVLNFVYDWLEALIQEAFNVPKRQATAILVVVCIVLLLLTNF